MAERVPLLPGNLYHIYNRGVEYRDIFVEERNWWFFSGRLVRYLEGHGRLVAYCLMPDHYHLLVEVLCEDFGRKVMQSFGTSYVLAFNRQERRVGPLFQGRHKAKHVDSDEYLLTLSRYIHMNPVRAGLVKRPGDWAHSSFNDYLNFDRRDWLHPEPVLELFKVKGHWARQTLTLEQTYGRYVTLPKYRRQPWEGLVVGA